MTDKNKTEIVVVLDRSGSMRSIAVDMEGGFKTFVEDQKKLPGECSLSLYQFDHDHSVVYENKPLSAVASLNLVPRGNTALYDGLALAITRVGDRLAKLPEDQRPGAVVVLVITDGQENASRVYNRDAVQRMVKNQNEKYNWQFVYLGADASTFTEAQALGMGSVQFDANSRGIGAMYNSTSKGVGDYRSQVLRGVQHASLDVDAINKGVTESKS